MGLEVAPQLAKPGPASKAVRRGAVCELTGTIGRKEVARRR